MAFVDLDGLRAAAYALGHPVQGVILRGTFAGRIAVSSERGSVAAFCADHRKLSPRNRRRAGTALRGLRMSEYYRWTVRPEAPPEIPDSERPVGFDAVHGEAVAA